MSNENIQNVFEQYNELKASLSVINKEISDLKKARGYKDTRDRIQEKKDELYRYMIDLSIPSYENVTIEQVMSSEDKRHLKLSEKSLKVKTVLSDVIDDENDLNQLVDIIAQL